MRVRRLGQAVIVGVVSVGTAVGLLGLPAGADARDATVGGTVALYTADGSDVFGQWDVGAGIDCSTPVSTVSMDGGSSSGTWSLSSEVDETFNLFGVDFRWQVEGEFAGDYTATDLTGTGSLVITLRRTTAPGSCAYLSTAGTCTITATDIDLFDGVHDVSPPPTIDPDDSGAFGGENGSYGDFGFEVAVAGTACGSLLGLDDGAIEIDLGWTAL